MIHTIKRRRRIGQRAQSPQPAGREIPGLRRDRVEEQLRRARRWDLPRSLRAYPSGPRMAAFAISPHPLAEYGAPPTGLTSGVLVASLFNCLTIVVLTLIPAPEADEYAEPTLRLVIAEARTSQPLESLTVDISTPLGKESEWDRFDQAIGMPDKYVAPLAIPSIIDRFVGNPLSIATTAGGEVVVGGSRGMASRGEEYAGAKILGVRARGERFVFVLDNSLGMVGPAWKQARQEVLAGVSRLRDGQRFAVLLTDSSHYPVKGSFRADALHVARVGSAAQLAQWLDTRQLVQGAETLATMESAMARHADAIYLIGGEAFPVELAEEIRRNNRWVEEDRLKVPGSILHTIGVALSEESTRGLQRIATENGGHFFHVTPTDR